MSDVVKMGRPSTYTPEIAATVCERISKGETLRQVCRDEGMPSVPTFLRWVGDNVDGLTEQYTRARSALMDHWAEEIVDIAEDGSNDWMEKRKRDGEVEVVLDREHVARSQLRIDTRKWLLSKLAPKKYGDRITHAGDAENPVHVDVRGAADEIRDRVAGIAAAGRANGAAGETH